jgi:hypothetical protein
MTISQSLGRPGKCHYCSQHAHIVAGRPIYRQCQQLSTGSVLAFSAIFGISVKTNTIILISRTKMNQEAIRSIELSTDYLFDLIESKLHLLKEMQSMSLAQTDLVAQHDMTSLMTLLSRKQELMGALGDVQLKLARFQNQDPEQRKWSSPDRRKTCQEMVKRCDQLLQELIVMEDRSLGNMNLQRDTVAAQLQQNIDACTIQNAYQSSDLDESSFESSLSIEG